MPKPFDTNQAMRGLQSLWPAGAYQAQVPDRQMPAMTQTWGPYLDALHANTKGTPKLTSGGGSIGSEEEPYIGSQLQADTLDLIEKSRANRATSALNGLQAGPF